MLDTAVASKEKIVQLDSSAPLVTARLPQWVPAGSLIGIVILLVGISALIDIAGNRPVSWLGPLLVAVLIWIVVIYILARVVEGKRRAFDRLMSTLVWSAFVVAVAPLVSLLWTVIVGGIARMDALFFTNSMRGVVGQGGGALHAIIGTVEVTLFAALISVPIGLLTAIYIVEYGKRKKISRAITFFVDVMTGIPSIVAGLFAYSLFLMILGPGSQNGFAGSVALSILMIPVVVRSSEEMLRLVPADLREASYALGVPRWRTITKVVLPTALPGITTGIMLAISRVVGETAPLLIVSGFTHSMNYNLFDGPMMTLPVFVYNSFMSQGADAQAYVDRAWAGALTLILIVVALNLVARFISRLARRNVK